MSHGQEPLIPTKSRTNTATGWSSGIQGSGGLGMGSRGQKTSHMQNSASWL